MRLGLICDGEPGLTACQRLGRALAHEGAAVTLISTVPPGGRPTAAGDHSGQALGWLPLTPLAAATSDLVQGLDALGVFLEGSALQEFRAAHRQAAALRGQSPCLLFTGPLRPLCGDALMADLLPRLDYDLIAVQGETQRQELEWLLRSCGRSGQAHSLLGLWCLATEPIGCATTPDPVLLVLDEAQVPPSPFANGILYQRLRSIALETPSWQVRLQPDAPLPANPADWPETSLLRHGLQDRQRPANLQLGEGDDLPLALETPSWQVRLQPDAPLPADPADWPETSLLWQGLQDRQRPANLQLGEGDDLPLALMQATACLGISSSWLITAMVWGKPTVVLGDYGIRTEFNGPFFFGSGCMARLADCLPLERLRERPAVNAEWLAARGWAITDGPARLLRRLEELRP